jgi:hypothetical protein
MLVKGSVVKLLIATAATPATAAIAISTYNVYKRRGS